MFLFGGKAKKQRFHNYNNSSWSLNFLPLLAVYIEGESGAISMTAVFFLKYSRTITRWWFQPSWKILVKYSQIGSFPQVGVKTNNIWNHHLDNRWFLKTPRVGGSTPSFERLWPVWTSVDFRPQEATWEQPSPSTVSLGFSFFRRRFFVWFTVLVFFVQNVQILGLGTSTFCKLIWLPGIWPF